MNNKMSNKNKEEEKLRPPVQILPYQKDKEQILLEHDLLGQETNQSRKENAEQLSQANFVQDDEEAKDFANGSSLLQLSKNGISDSKNRTATDQSELSIGNRTAEDLVGDILCSDSLEDDAIFSKIEVKNLQKTDQLANSSQLESSLQLRKRMVRDQAMITEHKADVSGKPESYVASPPSRILFSYSSQNQNDGLDEEIPVASENPFEVAESNDKDLDDKEYLQKHLEVCNFDVDQAAVLGTDEDKNVIEKNSKQEQGEIADSTQNDHTLGIAKQRSYSDSAKNDSEFKSEEKKTKKRNILQKISLLVGQEESKNEATDEKEINKNQQTSTIQANSVVNQKQLPEPPLTTKAKRGGIMSKFFSKKKVEKDDATEEKKDTATSGYTTKACSKPIGVASRFVKFFSMKFVEPKETKKEVSITGSASLDQQPQKDESSPEKDQAYFDLPQAVDQDDSNLDMGFRANDEDQYRVDIIDQEEDRLVDEECDSDETDDEIYSAHEGLDFRPSGGADQQFSFAMPRTYSHTTPDTAEQFTHNGRQSYPTSDSSDSNQAPGSAYTPSIGSFDNQNFEPRQRAQSQINQDELQHMLLQQQVNTESKEQVQFQFPETLNTKSRSPFEIPIGQGQPQMDRYQPLSSSDYQNQSGQYRHSAGAVNSTINRGYEALTSIENRTTATGSHALITARTGCDKQPFALCTAQDEHQQQFMTNPSRQSAFIQANHMEQKIHVDAQMRISAPFTPTRPLNSFSSHQPTFIGMDQNAQIVQQNQQQMTCFSDMQLGSSQMQTLNLAVSLISNRPSAPYKTNNNQNYQNSNQQTETRLKSQSSPRSNQTDSRASNNRLPNQRSSNASITAQNSQKDNNQNKGRDSAISNPTSANNTSTTNSKRSKRGRHRGNNKKDEGGVKSKAMEQEEEEAQKQAFKCICCNNKALTCILEQQIDQYANLPAEERIKSMILADQQLQHFQPIDSKKFCPQSSSQNTQNSQIRAGIEGRLKDDIWHECCDCCHLVRKNLLGQMKGMASELCRDQICSKFIQVQLSRCASTDIATIDLFYQEICRDEENVYNLEQQQQTANPTNILNDQQDTPPESLMKNVFGNYVIQLLFEKGTPERINQFYKIMLKQSNRLSFDQFGCRIIQKALVCLSIDKKLEIIAKFDKKMLIEMMFSEEGNYIVQCIILHLPSEKIQFIIPLVQSQVLQLCKDKRGCRVIQRMLEKFPRTDINVPIIQQIIASANELTPQQYGNYVITHILQNGLEDEKVQIINAIIKNIVKFSLYQLGSNVVENCLKGAPVDYQDSILKRIIAVPVGPVALIPNQVTLANLLENQFGNYVIQHAFNLSNDENKRLLYEKMEQAANQGFVDRQNTYAKHVYALVAQKFGTQEQKRDINNSKYRSHTQGKSSNNPVQTSVSNQRNLNEAKIQRRQQQQQQNSKVQQQIPQKPLQQHNDANLTIDMMTLRQKMLPQKKQDQTVLANNKSEGDDDDQDDSEKSDTSDQEDDSKNNNNIVEGKTKRRRRRKRKRGCARNRKPMLCQEDILEQLSDSDRQEYLKQLPVTPQNTRSVSQSLFVFGSGFASVGSLVRTSNASQPAADQEIIKREDNNQDKQTGDAIQFQTQLE